VVVGLALFNLKNGVIIFVHKLLAKSASVLSGNINKIIALNPAWTTHFISRILDDFGWNFREAKYHEENRRTLYKMYGIKVNGIKVNGIKVNGIKVNRIKVNGIKVNGIKVSRAVTFC
jgi:hypothetical protein